MSLFQNAVVAKYLQAINQDSLTRKWNKFTSYFHNLERQESIRNSKEEQYKEGFLRELFVKILDYTLSPEPNFNLTTEYKNVKDSKKADDAILVSNKVRDVIELKGTNTTDLGKKKIKLSLSEEAEWEDYFLQEQQKALTLKQQITTTDQEIDKMVYELYGLTEEEISTVEKN